MPGRRATRPSVDAYRIAEIVTIDDLRAQRDRWPIYTDCALGQGVLAVAAIPMCLNTQAIGALTVYSTTARRWSDDDLTASRVLADIATSYLINAAELAESHRTSQQLQQALDTRIVIEQAKGAIASQRQVPVDEAFEILRGHARNHNASLRSVATAVVDVGLKL